MKPGKLLLLAALALVFTSCLTVGRIERNCDKFAQICTTDKETLIEYRDTTIYRTDTFFVPLPVRDTVFMTDTVTIKNGMAFLPTRHFERGIIGMDIGVSYSRIKASAYLTDSTILFPVRDTIFIKDAFTSSSTTQTVQIVKKVVPKFYKFTLWFFIITVLAVGVVITIKLYKAKINTILNNLPFLNKNN